MSFGRRIGLFVIFRSHSTLTKQYHIIN